MSDLRERLARMKSASFAAQTPQAATEPADDGWAKLSARMMANANGSFVLRKRRYPLDYRHGMYTLGALAETAHALTYLLSAGPSGDGNSGTRQAAFAHDAAGDDADVACRRLLFLDTETTGLGVGAGNMPFMIGLGFLSDDAFVVEQLFLRNPADEPALLLYLADRLRGFSTIVTYNGKSFDWPVLLNRFVLNRMPKPAGHTAHLDLLHPSRNLWKHTMESCNLGKVEEAQLGIARADDLPGSLAPAYYAHFLACGDKSLLKPIFAHNESDILTLSVLAHHFARLLAGDVPPERLRADELYRAGVWLDKYGRKGLAEQFLRRIAVNRTAESEPFLSQLALYFKRKGDLRLASELWLALIKASAAEGRRLMPLDPWIELAKYYEHEAKDIDAALSFAEEALLLAQAKRSLSRPSGKRQTELDGLRRRIARLKRKQAGIMVFRP